MKTVIEMAREAGLRNHIAFFSDSDVAAELRRLHQVNQEMLEALSLILASDDWPEIERIARAVIAKGEQA